MAGFSFEDALAPPDDGGKGGFSFEDATKPAPKAAKEPQQEATALSSAKQAAGGIYESVGSLLSVPVDATAWLLNRIPGVNIQEPFGGSASQKRGMRAIGIDEPQNTTERVARGMGAGIGAMFAPEAAVAGLSRVGAMSPEVARVAREFTGVTDSLEKGAGTAAVGAASGAGAAGAEEMVPEPYKPLAGMVGGLAAGVPAALATEAVPLARTAGRAVGDLAAPLTDQGVNRMAATQVRARATNAEDVLQRIAEGNPDLVRGSQGTTAQVGDDIGLLGLEREVQSRNPEAFADRRAEQNQARVDALPAPAGSVMDSVGLYQKQLLQADQETEQAVNTATQRARAILDTLPPGKLNPEEYGSALRTVAEKAEGDAYNSKKALWNALDPDGTLTLPMANTKATADKLLAEVDPAAGQQLNPTEDRLLQAYSALDGPQPLDRLRKIRSELSSEIRKASGITPDPQAVRRFTELKKSVDRDIEEAVAGKVATEKQAVAAGELDPAQTLEANLARQAEESGVSAETGERTGTGPSQVSGGPAAGATGVPGAGEPAGGEPRGTAGNQGVQKPVAEKAATKAADLLQFIASEGGIRDDMGDLRGMNAQRFMPGRGMLISEKGVPLDEMRSRAQQEGYLPPDDPMKPATSSIQDLLDAIQDNLGGKRVYREADRAQVEAEEEAANRITDARRMADDLGIDHSKIKDRDIEELVAQAARTREAQLDAMDKAAEDAMAAEYAGDQDLLGVGWLNETLPTGKAAPRSAEAAPGVTGPEAEAGNASGVRPAAPGSAQGTLALPVEPLPRDVAARYKTVRQAEYDYHRTFENGPIGAMLQEKAGGGYKLLNSALPEKVFHSGPTGFEDVQSFRQAVGDASALPVLTDYAVADLRRSAMRADGTIDPKGLARWRAQHTDALRAIPDLDAKLSSVAKASDAMAEVAALRKDMLTAFQGHAAAKLMNASSPEDAVRIIGGMFGAKNSVQQIRQLVDQAGSDKNALDGLRNAVAEYMKQKLISNTEAGTSGTNLIKADQFQTFVRQNVAALRQLFSPEEIANLNNIGADLRRANRSITAVKVPGSSNTPQDILANQRHGAKTSILSQIALEAAATGAGALAGGAHGALTAGGLGLMGMMGARVFNAMRDTGMRRVDEVLTRALLDPEFAGQLLRRFPERPEITLGPSMARNLRRLSVAAPAQAFYPNP